MEDAYMFYMYEWFIVETGEIIYVGKGTRNRYKAKKKNDILNWLLETNNCDVRIVAYYETEEEAFEAEKNRIIYLKSIGQAVCNKYIYKTGGVSRIWTDEKRKEMSENNPMKRQDQRERMSKFNPMKNQEVVERVISQKRKPIYIGDEKFSCQKEAAKRFSVSTGTILNWLKNGHNKSGVKCGYILNKRPAQTIKITKQPLPNESIIYNGIEFPSAIEVARYANIKDKRTIIRWCKNGYSSNGIPCRFKNDIAQYEYHKPNKAHGMKPIEINGIKYSSRKEACIALKCDYRKLYQLTNQYQQANQQPSCGNSDNNTAEGSTTNG